MANHTQGASIMSPTINIISIASVGTLALALAFSSHPTATSPPETVEENALDLIREGRHTFRHDTFGDEAFWSDTLLLDQAIAGVVHGGVGPGLAPSAALALGLKLDVDALPAALRAQIAAGTLDLGDPANTLALLELDAVVGVRASFMNDRLDAVGITCALCHSTVDDSFAPSIGARLDGWPNRDLNVGEVIAFAPDLSFFANHLGVDQALVRRVLRSWGPGKFDAHLILDGQVARPTGGSAAVLIPPALGLAGVNLATYGGWGGVSHWNAFVATIEMGGQGRLYDPRLRDAVQFPLAAAAGFDDIVPQVDLVTSKLAALQVYQLLLPVPEAPPGSFDPVAAERGQDLFDGAAGCARCHVPPLYTEPGHNVHTGAEIGIDDFQSSRSPALAYRTTPLRGMVARTEGGYYHDGRFATLTDVVEHYDTTFSLGLSSSNVADLVEFLKSL
jgi:hypothetical protein